MARRLLFVLMGRSEVPPQATPAAPVKWRNIPVDRTGDRSAEEWIDLFARGRTVEILNSFDGRDRAHLVLPDFSVPGEAAARLRAVVFIEGLLGNISDDSVIDRVQETRGTLLAEAAALAPDWPEIADWRAINWFVSGQYDKALEEFSRAQGLRDRLASIAGLEPRRVVYLPRSCAFSIGLMVHLDGYIKRKILTDDKRPYILLTASSSVINPAFLDYWRSHVDVVTDMDRVAVCEREEPVYAQNWNWVLPSDGTADRDVDHIHRRIARVQRQWRDEGRPPLLTLNHAHRDALEMQKRQWGMKKDDWFVCLHVRSSGFHREAAGGANDFRNSDIEDYYPAIRLIVEMGGWVVRMGDAAMPPLVLDRLPSRVIDYAVGPEKSAILDVALCASCRLFVAACSGLAGVAGVFGRPCALVNYPVQIGLPWFPDDIFTFKRVYSKVKGRYLSIEEILSSTIPYAITQHLLAGENVILRDNDAAEITELVREALLRDAYSPDDHDTVREVRMRFAEASDRHRCGISGRLGAHFSLIHAAELLGERENTHAPPA